MKILGITFEKTIDKKISSLKDYIFSLFVVFEKNQKEAISSPSQFIFSIRNQTSGLQFDISIEDAIRMFVDGKEQIKRYMNPPIVIETIPIEELTIEVINKKEKVD